MNSVTRADYKSFYQAHLEVKYTGNGKLKAFCPFHSDKNPSLSVDLKTGLFNCFGCKESGNASKFAQLMNIPANQVPANLIKYSYYHESGELAYQIIRDSQKSFKARKLDEQEKWIYKIGEKPILYNLPNVIKTDTLAVCEGEKDVDTLSQVGITATTNPFGAGKWRSEFNKYLKDKNLLCFYDNDIEGKKHIRDIINQNLTNAKSIKFISLPVGNKEDVTDYLQKYGSKESLMKIIQDSPNISDIKKVDEILKLNKKSENNYTFLTGEDLLKKDIPDPIWIVDKIIPEGLTLFGARAKSGKSYFALQLALGTCQGGKFLDYDVLKAGVLFLALDDPERRLQERIKRLTYIENQKPNLDNFYYRTSFDYFENGGKDALINFLDNHYDVRFVIIDTFEKFCPAKRANDYTLDYQRTAHLQDIAHFYHIGIMIIHHFSKRESENITDKISGSTGLPAGSDTIITLDSHSSGKKLQIIGKDIEETSIIIKFDSHSGLWQSLGSSHKFNVNENKRKILETLELGSFRPSELAEETGINKNLIRQYLLTMKNDNLIDYNDKTKSYHTASPV